jgi:hypothetical protein
VTIGNFCKKPFRFISVVQRVYTHPINQGICGLGFNPADKLVFHVYLCYAHRIPLVTEKLLVERIR